MRTLDRNSSQRGTEAGKRLDRDGQRLDRDKTEGTETGQRWTEGTETGQRGQGGQRLGRNRQRGTEDAWAGQVRGDAWAPPGHRASSGTEQCHSVTKRVTCSRSGAASSVDGAFLMPGPPLSSRGHPLAAGPSAPQPRAVQQRALPWEMSGEWAWHTPLVSQALGSHLGDELRWAGVPIRKEVGGSGGHHPPHQGCDHGGVSGGCHVGSWQRPTHHAESAPGWPW